MVNHILLIDDDKEDAGLFLKVLQEVRIDASFEYMNNGLMIPEWFKHEDKMIPEIIFIDINMPNITGWDCLVWLKGQESLKEIPVVMYTHSNNPKDRDKAKLLGAADVIVKPYSFAELKDILVLFVG